MSIRAKIYVSAVVACGILSTGIGILHWQTKDPVLFLAILIFSVFSSFLKVTIPGIQGSMSMNFIFIMLAVTRLSLGETLAVGVAATLVQTFWHRKKQNDAVIVTFNTALIAAVIGVSCAVFHAEWFHGLALAYIVRLWIVAAVYFVLNTGAVAGIISITGGRNVCTVWIESYGWSYAYFWLGASAVSIFNALERIFGLEMAVGVLPIAFVAYRSYRMRIDSLEKSRIYADEQRRHAEEVATLHLRTIRALALAIEAKDTTTAQHLHRVQTYAVAIGRELNLAEDEMQALNAASILHDIGKIAVPEYIISKPGKLSKEEFEIMKIHPVVGGEIAESVRFPFPVAPIVSAHHEKWDGTGYPYGLKGDEIPVGARILAAVDCLDALASDRQYRRALPIDKAMDIVRSESGKAYDPKIVEILSRRYEELETLARSTLSEHNVRFSITAKIERGVAPDAGLEVGHLNKRGAQNVSQSVLDSLAEFLKETQSLEALDRMLACPRGITDLIESTLLILRSTIPFDAAALFLRDRDLLSPEFVAGREAASLRDLRIQIGTGLAGWVAEHRIPLLNGNPGAESGWKGGPPPAFALQSALAVPLETEQGVFGVLALYREQKDSFHSDHLRICMGLRSRFAYALQSAIHVGLERTATGYCSDCNLLNAGALFNKLDGILTGAAETRSVLVLAIRLDRSPSESDLTCLQSLVKQFGEGLLARVGERDLVAVLPDVNRAPVVMELALASTLAQAGTNLALQVGTAQSPADGSNAGSLIAVAASRLHHCAGELIADASGGLVSLMLATSGEPQQGVPVV